MNYQEAYSEMHQNEKYFPGFSISKHVARVAELVQQCQPSRILDYGSGKGFQYLVRRVHEKWGGMLPYCYDVGVRQLSTKPEGKFEFIICTDVMEHIEEQDLHEVISDILNSSATVCTAFFSISTVPARKEFPDGRNLHVTVRPKEWWEAVFKRYQRDGLRIELAFEKSDA
jgi:hypothetical protein